MPITAIQNDSRRRRSTPMTRARGYRTLVLALLLAGLLGIAAQARAAVTIGQLALSPPGQTCPSTAADYLQPSVTGGNLYSARAAGTITSWSTNSSGAGATYVFKIFRRTSDPDAFQLVAKDTQHTLSAGINTVQTSLHV